MANITFEPYYSMNGSKILIGFYIEEEGKFLFKLDFQDGLRFIVDASKFIRKWHVSYCNEKPVYKRNDFRNDFNVYIVNTVEYDIIATDDELNKLEHDGKYITYMDLTEHFRKFMYVGTNKQGNHIYNMNIPDANYKIALREIARALNESNPKQGYYKAIMDAYKNFKANTKANTTDTIEETEND